MGKHIRSHIYQISEFTQGRLLPASALSLLRHNPNIKELTLSYNVIAAKFHGDFDTLRINLRLRKLHTISQMSFEPLSDDGMQCYSAFLMTRISSIGEAGNLCWHWVSLRVVKTITNPTITELRLRVVSNSAFHSFFGKLTCACPNLKSLVLITWSNRFWMFAQRNLRISSVFSYFCSA